MFYFFFLTLLIRFDLIFLFFYFKKKNKKTLGKKRQNLVSNDDIYIKYLTLFQNMKKPKFHLFNKQKSEIEQNELFYIL